MATKKARKKSKTRVNKSAKKSVRRTKKPVDLVQVRENINDLVGNSAKDIASEVIKVAKTGQLASAKYLFEAVGLYPATEQTEARPEHSLAHTLLTRMGLPLDPVVCGEELVSAVSPSAKSLGNEATVPGVVEEEPGGEHEKEHSAAPTKSEE